MASTAPRAAGVAVDVSVQVENDRMCRIQLKLPVVEQGSILQHEFVGPPAVILMDAQDRDASLSRLILDAAQSGEHKVVVIGGYVERKWQLRQESMRLAGIVEIRRAALFDQVGQQNLGDTGVAAVDSNPLCDCG
jgi:hypothetical protein